MVSLFGRGFDSLQLHKQKKDHLTAVFLSYVEHVYLILVCYANALHFIPLGGLPGRSRTPYSPQYVRTCVGIGASECLERERGPGGPPSERSERVHGVN